MSAMHVPLLWPIHKSRRFILDHPEILLIAVTVVAAKLSFPFQGYQSLFQEVNTNQDSVFRWTKWRKVMRDHSAAYRLPKDEPSFEKITVDDVARMTPKELDVYFSHIASLIDKKRKSACLIMDKNSNFSTDESPIVGFFPLESAPDLEPPRPGMPEDQIDNRIAQVLVKALKIRGLKHSDSDSDEEPDEELSSNRTSSYEAFRSTDDLTEIAREFYEAAGMS